jgi:hypothetical protein
MADDFFVAVHWRSIQLACGKKNGRPVRNCRCIVARAVQRWQVGARGRGKAVERDPHLLTTTSDIQSGPAR